MRYSTERTLQTFFSLVAVVCCAVLVGCSENPVSQAPPTVAPASAAVSPPVATPPAGTVSPVDVAARAAVFDAATSSLVVLGDEPASRAPSTLSFIPAAGGPPREVYLPDEARTLFGDGRGTVYLASNGSYFRVDVGTGKVTTVDVAGQEGTEFTSIAVRADGKVVIGSANGGVYTLRADGTVDAEVNIFARVDAIVTQGDVAVVLDRGQTSVTSLDPGGAMVAQALRAGEGATTMVADAEGRVLVVDPRGDELMVFGVDPLLMRQRYPVRDSPFGLVGSRALVWVSQTATNVVVGYDLATGIPVEKVRYPTVRQPDVLAFDDATNTLYVVSSAGDGIQAIKDAGRRQ